MKLVSYIQLILFVLLTMDIRAETFKAGSYIIDMGVIPQTYNNGLQPYGMVYDMVINKEVPLYWIIRQGKKLYETDFTYTCNSISKEYKAGSFVLPAIYVTPAVESAIASWRAKGVVIDGPTQCEFDAPAYNYISSFPNAVLDQQNHALTEGLFYNHTSIPTSYWSTGTPANITTCCDVYALPHADPQKWTATDKATYLAYTNSKAKNFLWQGCHSVGAVEAHNPYLNMNILTTNGQIAWKKDPNYAFKNNNTPPYAYDLTAGDHPIMQIASPLDSSSTPTGAHLNITADITIKVKDKNGFEIIDNFPDINISTTVHIWAKKFTLGKNITINILPPGHLYIHVKSSKNFKLGNGSSITGPYTVTYDGGKSGNGSDGDIGKITSDLTIGTNKNYNKFVLQYKTGNGGVSTALGNGSQRIYIPRPDSQWRPTTTVAIWDPDNVNNTLNGGNPNKAALVAFGRAFGDPQNGILVQQASHTATTGTEAENVSSGRIYGNLLLQASIEKRPIVKIDAPNSMNYPNSYHVTATVKRGAGPFTFKWSMSCPGSTNTPGIFTPAIDTVSDRNSTVLFTPNNQTLQNCIMRVHVTDGCTRKNFATKIVGIIGYNPPLGAFNVVHANEDFSSTSNQDPILTTHPTNSLYTQVSRKDFNVTLVSLDRDKTSLYNRTGNVILELIDTSGVTELEPDSCAKASTYADVTDKISLSSNGAHFNNNSLALASGISYPYAVKEIGFRISYHDLPLAGVNDHYSYGIPDSMSKSDLDRNFPACSSYCGNSPQSSWECYRCIATPATLGGYGKAVCARDNFSIRPAKYTLALHGTAPFIGGRDYNFEINATTFYGNNDEWYTEDLSTPELLFSPQSEANITSIVNIPSGCTLPDTNPPVFNNSIKFVSGEGKRTDNTSLIYRYNNVGDINITAMETKWVAKADMNKNYTGGSAYERNDCVVGSDSNMPDANGKIGCLIKGVLQATFIPSRFINTLRISNHNTDNNFTYIANSNDTLTNYGASIHITYTAVLDDNSTAASNYTAGCYAHDINTTITLKNNSSLGWGSTQNRVWLFDSSDNILLTKNFPARFTHTFTDGNFSNGVATINMLFDFNRSMQIPDNPFIVYYNDFNITDVHDLTYPSIVGNDFNRTVGNSNESTVTFLYGRATPTKEYYESTTSPVSTPIMVQVYCNKWPASTANCPGIDVINGQTNEYQWFLSIDHNMSQGDGNITLQATNGSISSTSNTSSNPAVVSIIGNTNGTDKTIEVSGLAPNVVDINFDTTTATSTSKWLIYNKNSNITPSPFYRVKFIGISDWTGYGKTGNVVDSNISKRNNRRLDW